MRTALLKFDVDLLFEKGDCEFCPLSNFNMDDPYDGFSCVMSGRRPGDGYECPLNIDDEIDEYIGNCESCYNYIYDTDFGKHCAYNLLDNKACNRYESLI